MTVLDLTTGSFLARGFAVEEELLDGFTLDSLARRSETLRANGVGTSLEAGSDFFFDVVRREELVGLASRLVGRAVVPIHAGLRRATGGTAAGGAATTTPARQAQFRHQAHFDDELAVSVLLPVHESLPLVAWYADQAPAVGQLLPHRTAGPEDTEGELVADPAGLDWTRVVVPAGAALVQHAYAIHRYETPHAFYAFTYRGSGYRQRRATDR